MYKIIFAFFHPLLLQVVTLVGGVVYISIVLHDFQNIDFVTECRIESKIYLIKNWKK